MDSQEIFSKDKLPPGKGVSISHGPRGKGGFGSDEDMTDRLDF